MSNKIIEEFSSSFIRKDIDSFKVGDTVEVHFRVVEGSRERVQVFKGIVIARNGSGIGETIFMHRVAYDVCMEKKFLLNSPNIKKIVRVREGKVRRAKLFYLRGKKGKQARVKGLVD